MTKNIRVLTFALLASALNAPLANATPPAECKSDAQKFCRFSNKTDGSLDNCMYTNYSRLSAECKTAMGEAAAEAPPVQASPEEPPTPPAVQPNPNKNPATTFSPPQQYPGSVVVPAPPAQAPAGTTSK